MNHKKDTPDMYKSWIGKVVDFEPKFPIMYLKKRIISTGHEYEKEIGNVKFKTLSYFRARNNCWTRHVANSTLYFYQSKFSGKVCMIVRSEFPKG